MKRRVIHHLMILTCFIVLGIFTVYNHAEAAKPVDQTQEENKLTTVKYKIDNQFSGTKDMFLCYKNAEGVLYLPLKDILEASGYVVEPCPKCGHDEVYPKIDDGNGGKGHYFINWYQSLLSFSGTDETAELSAPNEIIDGRTYCPLDLYEKIGMKATVYEDSETILLSDNNIRAIYFYSSTCKTCEEIQTYLDEMEDKYPSIKISRFDIYEPESYDLLQKYGDEYKVEEGKKGFTPSVYISDQVLIGAEIKAKLEQEIIDYNKSPATKMLATETMNAGNAVLDGNIWTQIGSALGLGFLNGLNPCSLSIFLFLLSLLLTSRDKMLRCGFGFILGKTVMFFLLGTILYKAVKGLASTSISKYINIFMVVFAILFAILNLFDFFNAKNEKYGNMKLQLPSPLKKLNHNMLRWANRFTTAKVGAVIMFLIGMVVATGEFLCTGQIYLSNVVILVQEGSTGLYPFLLLALYSVAFIIPLVILMIALYFGKKSAMANEFVLEKIPLIKLISAILFVGMAIYFIFA